MSDANKDRKGSNCREGQKDRGFIYDQCLEKTQEILNILYGSKKLFVEAKTIHPIEKILIYSYDQIVDLPNSAILVSQMLGILLPLSDDPDIVIYERLKEHLILAKKNNIDLTQIVSISKADYPTLAQSKKATYYNRTTYFLKEQLAVKK
jgi:hypothetical protein